MSTVFQAVILAVLSTVTATSPKAEPVNGQHLEAELLSEVSALEPGRSFWVGLRLKMEPGWHVYWKNPGDAGLPVSLAWQLPAGFSAGDIQWPYPMRVEMPPLVNYGYEGEILLPLKMSAAPDLAPGSRVELRTKAKWLVCNEVCLPGSADLSLSLPAAGGASPLPPQIPGRAGIFQRVRDMLPLESSDWKFSAQRADTSIILVVEPSGQASGAPGRMVFFPDEQEVIEGIAPQKFYPVVEGFALELSRPAQVPGADGSGSDSLNGVLVASGGWDASGKRQAMRVRAALETGKSAPKALAAAVITTGIRAEHRAVAAAFSPSGPPLPSGPEAAGSGFSRLMLMLSLAFAGGLILNLMPCVLPVLSLKIFDFVKRAGQSRWKVFSHGLTFTAGVLISFWILAGLLLVLRQGGQELGWGFQLQSPSFLMVLCALFFFFSLNLFGVFELGYIFTRVGAGQGQHGHIGSFMAGVTATVVATPCTAPFMGSAMGYAFTQPPQYALLVFTFLGLGMAFPYLLLSGFPALMRFLPKPGAWMEHLKQFMGFPLLATAIWLAWVLGKQAGVDALIALLFVLLLAGVSAWILGKWTALHLSTPVRVIAGLVALVVFLPAFILVLLYMGQVRPALPSSLPGGAALTETDGIAWEPYSQERLAALTSQGTPVFIDFTADWCLSCKVNEKVALNSPEVVRKFHTTGLAALKADWTLRDEAIARALGKYGRQSIPLYVLHTGPGEKDFLILPEVLSPGIVLEAVGKLPLTGTTLR